MFASASPICKLHCRLCSWFVFSCLLSWIPDLLPGFCCLSCFCVDIIFISFKLDFVFQPAVPAVYNELGHLPIFSGLVFRCVCFPQSLMGTIGGYHFHTRLNFQARPHYKNLKSRNLHADCSNRDAGWHNGTTVSLSSEPCRIVIRHTDFIPVSLPRHMAIQMICSLSRSENNPFILHHVCWSRETSIKDMQDRTPSDQGNNTAVFPVN